MRRISTVVSAVLLVGSLSAACASPSPAPSSPARSATTPATAASTTAASTTARPTTTGSADASLAQRAASALVGLTAYSGRGYPNGADLPAPVGPTTQVCNKALDVDKAGHVAAARSWQGSQYAVTNVVHGYASATADAAVTQLRAAAGSCPTYTVGGATYTLGAAVSTPAYYGIDVSYTYCEQRNLDGATTALCTAVFAHGNLMAMLRVQGTSDSTSDTYTELLHLSDAAAQSVQA